MSEVAKRLREKANDSRDRLKPFNLLLDAAEEIERLQNRKEVTLEVLRKYHACCVAGDVPDYPHALFTYLKMDGYA